MINNKKPENVDFSDDTQDSPLESDNLEALIQEQLKDRELHVPTQSSDKNTIVSDNQFTNPENTEMTTMTTIDNDNSEHTLNAKMELLMIENKNLTS